MLPEEKYCLYLFILCFKIVFTLSTDRRVSCPDMCTCDIRPRTGKTSNAEWSKLKCGGDNLTLIDQLHLNEIEPHLTQLEISSSRITYLGNSFLKLPLLQKLYLNKNEIQKIEVGAFDELRNLKRLDLSYNNINELPKDVFEPLQSLERLKLSHNSITRIHEGVFNGLLSLKQLDISDNPLHCDCKLVWLIEWSKNSSVKLTQPPECKSPPQLNGQPLKKLRLNCNEDENPYSSSVGLELKPMHNQVVFEGDSLNLRCRSVPAGSLGGESRDARVTWSWENKDPTYYFNKIKIENRSFIEHGSVESQLKIDRIERGHSGDWYCHLLSEQGNHSTAISIIVLSDDSKYCSQIETKNNKGIYYWPKTIVGFTVDLPCQGEQTNALVNRVEPRAMYYCNESGYWENLNTSQCPYINENTKILEQFSRVNLSIAKGDVLDSAKKLRNFTGNGKKFTDTMDVVFISRTIENYLKFVEGEKELGFVLVDIIASVMQLPKVLLTEAQKESIACSSLVKSVEVICRDIPAFQSHKTNLAVDEFDVTGMFSGIRCIWYSYTNLEKNPGKFFHCSTNNKTVLLGSSDRIIEASIQIPTTLFYQLERQGKSTRDFRQLIVTMYENNKFFPTIEDSVEDVTSCVIGSKLVGVEVTNLTDPIYIMLRPAAISYTTLPTPVWWDQSLNNGSGKWSQEGCHPSHFTQGLLAFYCDRLGYFGLLQDTRFVNEYSGSCGIYQTEDRKICQGVGLVLHYLSLSTLLWMSVTASNMYKRLSKSDHLDNPAEDDLPPGVPIQKPILGLYLVGWGIGLIVCGISGAVNLREYASRNFCFLGSGPALSAVFVPAGMLLAFLFLFYFLTFCAIRNNDMNGQLSEGTQGTENVDLELLEVPVANGCVDRRSLQSMVTTDSDDVEDPEHSPIIQLKAHIIVLVMYCMLWAIAALTLTDTFRNYFSYQEDVCSILYCVLAFCLGTFILYFYCVARSDVRSQWTMMRKVLRGKQVRCCRSRTISDSHGNVQMASSAVVITNGNNTRHTVSALSSSSINSSGLTTKSNSHNSNRVKAVKKLNNCDPREDPVVIHNKTSNNVNLVAMHRQMYRSNNSMPTYHEITGPDCIEAFYNPRQSIVARKFFKKQRRNKRNDLGLRRRGDGGGTSDGEVPQARRTWRPSAESAVFLSSDMENASEKIGPTFFGYGSKVNNTNIHVGQSSRHKKSQSPKDPNILTDSDEESRNKLPLDRLVIGAEGEAGTSASAGNDRTKNYDSGLSRVDEISVSEEVNSIAVNASESSEYQGRPKKASRAKECDTDDDYSNDICNDGVNPTPDYRTVELQCSLGENSCSDLNSEINFCDSTNNDDSSCHTNGEACKCHPEYRPSHKRSRESEPECDSFHRKIDNMRLRSDKSFSESNDGGSDDGTLPHTPTRYITVVDPQFGLVKVSLTDAKESPGKRSASYDDDNDDTLVEDTIPPGKIKEETTV
ncbi:UNVERIFIED_CONTAM: hypothetical protein PYX00_007178 [Menopon gallinae]|uniref:G-protein coupled receptor 125 n=1 Tax=Menopon gallinae TaxID=328185 RepID=A0AAW2HIS5_9NEOP